MVKSQNKLVVGAMIAALFMACQPKSKPAPPPDTTAAPSATDTVSDTSGMWDYEDSDTIWPDSTMKAHEGARIALSLQAVVDTLSDTTTANEYIWVTYSQRTISTTIDTAVAVLKVDTIAAPPPVALGVPYGEFGLFADNKTLKAYTEPFNMSQSSVDPGGVCLRISAARQLKVRLVTTIGAGGHSQYLTGGKFDFPKWKSIVIKYNTSANRTCMASGVSDGTVIGNILMDEPEHSTWGGVVTKATLDDMADYVRGFFPTLPMGIGHGPPAYFNWRTGETFKRLDFVYYQYAYNVQRKNYFTRGDVDNWRKGAMASAAANHATPAFGINPMDGGALDTDGTWNCSSNLQYGKGTDTKRCRMPPDMVIKYGKALAPYGCYFNHWRWDSDYNRISEIKAAFSNVRAAANTAAQHACKL